MASVAIIGPGAIGSVVAARLGVARHHAVTVCARTSVDRLTIEAPEGKLEFVPKVLTNPAQAKPVDWVLVTTKAHDASAASAWFKNLRGPATPVAILQNGVEHIERFAPYLPVARILPVIVESPAERLAPGRVRQRDRARLTVPAGALGREFNELFVGTGIDIVLTEDFKSAAWRKLCRNVVGALQALLCDSAAIHDDPKIADLARQMVIECMAVARAEGAVLESSLPDTILDLYRKAPRDSINSLHADRVARRPLEIDARNGVVVRLGRKHGIATPFNAMAVSLLEALSRSERGSEATSGGATRPEALFNP